MTMTAYPETYLASAMDRFGDFFDYALVDCRLDREDFLNLFLGSEICTRMENAEPKYLVGRSGPELLEECLYAAGIRMPLPEPRVTYDRSPEYWVGWALAFFHWRSSRRYADIFRIVSFEEMLSLYPALHEADVGKFADILEERMRESRETNLMQMRKRSRLTQIRLSEQSGVKLRSIQMYEQRRKNINCAQAETVYRLARSLGCHMEDLLENGTG